MAEGFFCAYNPGMSPFFLFPAIFIGLLLAGYLCYLFAKTFCRLCRWVERKTGNATFAYMGMFVILYALVYAGYFTWLVGVVNASKLAGIVH